MGDPDCPRVQPAAAASNWRLTFESEHLVPARVEISPFDVGQQLVLLVRQQHHLHVRVRPAGDVLGGQVHGPDDLQRQRRLLEVVAQGELDPAELLRAAVGRHVLGVGGRQVGRRAAVRADAGRRLLRLSTVERHSVVAVAVVDDRPGTVNALTMTPGNAVG